MTSMAELEGIIEAAWEARDTVTAATTGPVREAVDAALDALDSGAARVAERRDGAWHVHQWLKKAVLLSFRLNDMKPIPGGPGGAPWWDKVESKFLGWSANRFAVAGFRAVPGAIVRRSAFIGKGAVLMPCFVNLGAYVGAGTMVDTWATIGSCAQIGTQLPYLGRRRHRRRARTAAGQPGHHRGQLLHRRALRSGRRRDRGRGLGAVDGRLSGPIDQDRRPRHWRDFSMAACRPIRWWSRARCPRARTSPRFIAP